MLKLAVLFTVISHLTVLIDDVESQSLQGLDLQDFLRSLKQQLLNGKQGNDDLEVNKLEDDEVDDEERHFGSLKNEQLGQLVALVRNDRDKVRQRPFITNDRKVTTSQLTKQILEQLLDQGKVNVQSQNRGYLGDVEARDQRNDLLVPSRLLGDSNKHDLQLMENLELKDDDSSDLSQYSKIYVILNSDSLSRSKNRSNLKDLLSRLLSGSRSENERILKKKERRYKGFVVNDSYRTARRNRDKDDYAEMDTPKKSRPSRGGGSSWGKRGGGRGHGDLRSGYNRGGGSAGHTAIPYINHHVGVYERDD